MPTQRIASLLAASTEILHGLGLADQIVGISHECDFPPDILDRPRLTRCRIDDTRSSREIDEQVATMTRNGEALYTVDADLLRSLHPTVIVTQTQCDVCAVSYDDVVNIISNCNELRDAKLVAMNPLSLEDLFRDIRIIADAVDASIAANKFIHSLRIRLQNVETSIKAHQRTAPPRTICIEWIEPLMVAANWMPDLIRAAGGRCDMTESGKHSTYTDWQDVIDYDPDVIIVSPCGFDEPRTMKEMEMLKSMPSWNSLNAVRNNRVYPVDGNAYFNRSGPRLVDSVELLAKLITR